MRGTRIILGAGCGAPDAADPYGCLPAGAVIGTASVRRQSQILHARPDLRCAMIRGNVQTRLGRVRGGEFAASLLALAGLRRLGLEAEAAVVLDPEAMVPAAGQGIVGITVPRADEALRELLSAIEDREAAAVSRAERALLGALDGSCRTPIGGHARLLPDGAAAPDRPGGAAGRLLPAEARGDRRCGGCGAARHRAGRSLRADSPADLFA